MVAILERISQMVKREERSNLVVRCPFHNAAIVARGLEAHFVNEHDLSGKDARLLRARVVAQATA